MHALAISRVNKPKEREIKNVYKFCHSFFPNKFRVFLMFSVLFTQEYFNIF